MSCLLRAGWQSLPVFLQHVTVLITVVPVIVSLVDKPPFLRCFSSIFCPL